MSNPDIKQRSQPWFGDFERRIEFLESNKPLSNPRAAAVRRKAYASLDRAQLVALADYIEQNISPRFSADDPELKRAPWKYFDLPKYLNRDAEVIAALGLDQSPPLKILDLGCGGGHFDFIAKCYGHKPLGIDLFEHAYDEILKVYGIPRIVHRITPDGSLPVDGPFDLITGFQIMFNNRESPILSPSTEDAFWSEDDWRTFLGRLFPLLSPNGYIFFALNKQLVGGYQHAPRLLRFFSGIGADIDAKRRWVTLTAHSKN